MSFTAMQHFTLSVPSFEWKARVEVCGLPILSVQDSFAAGHGAMRVSVLGVPVSRSRPCPELDQGALQRYLGEIGWFPMAARLPMVQWTALGPNSARAALTFGEASGTVDWEFGADGWPVRLSARRYASVPGGYELRDWWVLNTAYRAFDGVTVVSACEVYWGLPAGEFCWLRLQVEDVDFLV
jgi:hypothetical protein